MAEKNAQGNFICEQSLHGRTHRNAIGEFLEEHDPNGNNRIPPARGKKRRKDELEKASQAELLREVKEFNEAKENYDGMIESVQDEIDDSEERAERRASKFARKQEEVIRGQETLAEKMDSIDHNGKTTNALLEKLVEGQMRILPR